MAKKGSTGSGRTRNYATVVYPESAPENWIENLSGCFVPCFISPLHDKDSNPTGEAKKAHYHVLIMFDSVKTIEQAREICEKIGGVGCEKVNSLRGYARYLCHLDNPEKFQYTPSEVKNSRLLAERYNLFYTDILIIYHATRIDVICPT